MCENKIDKGFQTHASLNLYYKICACMSLARLAGTLEATQPEEQHGFQHVTRREEHRVAANRVVDVLPLVPTHMDCQCGLVQNFGPCGFACSMECCMSLSNVRPFDFASSTSVP